MDLERQIKTTRSCTLNGDDPGVQSPDSGITRPDFGTASRSARALRALLVLLVTCAALLGSPRAARAQADTTPPALESAETSVDGTQILLTFSEDLLSTTAPAAAFIAPSGDADSGGADDAGRQRRGRRGGLPGDQQRAHRRPDD